MAKKLGKEDKEAVEQRLNKVIADVTDAKTEVGALKPVKDSAPLEYTAEEGPDPGGKPCGKLYDAEDNIEVALLDLGGRPCGGGRPC